MKKYFIGCYNKSVILTYIGIISALFGIINISNLKIAMICLIISGICDLFDGPVARKIKRNQNEKEFGKQIDSLADVIASLVLPFFILIQICKQSNISIKIGILIGVFYVLMGITRLAWFNITCDNYKGYYKGIPVTYSALIIPIMYVIFKQVGTIFLIAYVLMGFAFIVNVKIKKPKGIWYIIFFVLALIVSGVILIS